MRVACLMMGLSLALLWAWLGAHPALHADAMTLAEVWRGVQQGAGLGPWLFSTACSLFPDLGATALASLWTQDLAAWQRWHGVFIGIAVAWGAARLMRQLWGLDRWQAQAFAGAGLCLGLLLGQPAGFGDLFSPGHHGWACALALWAWAWALRQETRPSRWSYSIPVAAAWGLTWASDSLFVVWALLPVLLLALWQSSWPRNRILATLLGTALVRWGGLAALRGTGAKVGMFRWGYAGQHAVDLWPSFAQRWPGFTQEQGPFLIVALLAVLLWASRARYHEQDRAPLLAWLLALTASLGLCLLTGLSARYLLFPAWSMVFCLPALLSQRWPAWAPLSLLVPALAALLWLAPSHTPAAPPLELRQAAWLDRTTEQRGLTQGWSDYFHSRPLRLFSQRGLRVLPMISQAPDHVDPYLWVVDRRLFPDPLPRPQFVVMNGLDGPAVQARLGAPEQRLQGEGLEVWIYGADPKEQR